MAPLDTTLLDLTAGTSTTTPLDELANPQTALHIAGAQLLGHRQSTRVAYAAALRRWGQWLAENNVQPLAAQPDDIRAFLHELAATRRDVARHHLVVRKFYMYAHEQGLIAANPVAQRQPHGGPAANNRDAVTQMSDNAIRRRLEGLAREIEELQAELDRREETTGSRFTK